MRSTLSKLAIIVFLSLLSLQITNAATSISGKQTKGSAGQNAKLQCSPVTIASPKRIASVTGSNAGFWIMKGGSNVMKFYKSNDPSAIGKTLPAGTYYVYPNLKKGASTATVTITLK